MTLPASDKRRLKSVARRLADWFPENGRKLPWREEGVTLFQHVCVEVLVQRTRAETVSRFYPVFFERFSDWSGLDEVSIEELEIFLKPVGLWKRRAQAFKGLSSYAAQSGGKFPNDLEELLKIPAVGIYVANAILLFAHDKPEPLLDTNMARVIERYIRPRKLADIRYDPWLQSAGKHLVSEGNSIEVNWAVLDLGGMICTPKSPDCTSCPLRRGCAYARNSKKVSKNPHA